MKNTLTTLAPSIGKLYDYSELSARFNHDSSVEIESNYETELLTVKKDNIIISKMKSIDLPQGDKRFSHSGHYECVWFKDCALVEVKVTLRDKDGEGNLNPVMSRVDSFWFPTMDMAENFTKAISYEAGFREFVIVSREDS